MRKRLSPSVKRASPPSPAFAVSSKTTRYSPCVLMSSAARFASGRKPSRILSCVSRESTRRVDSRDMQLKMRLGLDRKSTRLHSSHVKTSYALFCLKQQKKLDLGGPL